LFGSDTFIEAYHLPGRAALVGDGSVAAVIPCSILLPDHLLRPPLPPCVWLISDPDMPDDFCTRHGGRISVVIPSTDTRQVHRPKYARKHGAGLAIESADIPAAVWRAAGQFWLYFVPIPLDLHSGRKRCFLHTGKGRMTTPIPDRPSITAAGGCLAPLDRPT
jgi:hypothetical protein